MLLLPTNMHLYSRSVLECKKLAERVARAVSRECKPTRYTRVPWGRCFSQSRLYHEFLAVVRRAGTAVKALDTALMVDI